MTGAAYLSSQTSYNRQRTCYAVPSSLNGAMEAKNDRDYDSAVKRDKNGHYFCRAIGEILKTS